MTNKIENIEHLNSSKPRNNSKKLRDSNLELLRIVAMSFIVLHHFIVHGYQLAKFCSGHHSIFPAKDLLQSSALLVSNSFFIVGVNVFILISGYYSIRLKWKSLFSLAAFCIFYDYTQLYLADIFAHKGFEFYFSPIYKVFTHSGWFITCYVCLMLISPLLNKAIDSSSKREKIYILIGLCIINLHFGFLAKSTVVNPNGYNFMQFIFIYYIGRCLRNFENKINWRTLKALAGYIVCSILLAALTLLLFKFNQRGIVWKLFNYNNPLVILSSIFLFWTFKNMRIKSKFINWASSSILAVYLIHEGLFIRENLYKEIGNINNIYGFLSLQTLGILLGLFCTIMVGSILFDKVRMLITNPIVRWCSRQAEKTQSIFEGKLKKKIPFLSE